jgi:hypothetical protein
MLNLLNLLCKKLEDEFFAGEIPNEFGWYYHRKKWYCKS